MGHMGDVIHRLKYLRNLLRLSPGHPPNPPYLTVDSGAIANAPSRRLRHKQRNNRLNNPCLVYGAGLALEVCNRRNLTTRQLMRMLDAQSSQYHITPRTSEGKRSPRTEWEGGGGGETVSPAHHGLSCSWRAAACRAAARRTQHFGGGSAARSAQTPSAEDGKDGVTWEERAGAVGVYSSSTSRFREVMRSLMSSYASIFLEIPFCKVPQFW